MLKTCVETLRRDSMSTKLEVNLNKSEEKWTEILISTSVAEIGT